MGVEMKSKEYRRQLLERYIASFSKLDDMEATEEFDPIGWQLATGPENQYGFKKWRPASVSIDASAINILYNEVPVRLPRLFEELVLSYRWAEVDLGLYRLVANPLGADLSGLLSQMQCDPNLWESLLPAGFVQFGKGPDLDYDPVCFDTRSSSSGGDYRVVKIDHEGILCNYRIKIVDELAPSFEQLVLDTIRRAESIKAV
jgi:hypothetical protein